MNYIHHGKTSEATSVHEHILLWKLFWKNVVSIQIVVPTHHHKALSNKNGEEICALQHPAQQENALHASEYPVLVSNLIPENSAMAAALLIIHVLLVPQETHLIRLTTSNKQFERDISYTSFALTTQHCCSFGRQQPSGHQPGLCLHF